MSHKTRMFTCDCPECDGTGEIRCPECDGTGEMDQPFEQAVIPADHPEHAELVALQGDFRRVRRQSTRLAELRPDHADQYMAQRNAALERIIAQATKLLKR